MRMPTLPFRMSENITVQSSLSLQLLLVSRQNGKSSHLKHFVITELCCCQLQVDRKLVLGSVQLNFISRVFTTGTIDCADTQSSVRDEWKMCWRLSQVIVVMLSH